jgi:hypothetical protein
MTIDGGDSSYRIPGLPPDLINVPRSLPDPPVTVVRPCRRADPRVTILDRDCIRDSPAFHHQPHQLMNSRNILVAAVACLIFPVGSAQRAVGGTPLGGLAVALSPDGSTLVAGGDNRTLYVLDAESLEVKTRVWVGHSLLGLSFNKDGSAVVAEDTSGTMHLFDAVDCTVKGEVEKMEKLSVARDSDLAAGLDADFKGNIIRFVSLTDGSEQGKVVFDKENRVLCFGLNAGGDTLVVLGKATDDEGEPKVLSGDIPKELKGFDRDTFEQKNDGRTAVVHWFKVPGGEKIAEQKVFFTSTSTTRLFFAGEDALIINYANENARITRDGSVEMFELENSYNYGIGASVDQGVILTGGLRTATVTKTGDMGTLGFETGTLPGWPEYFKAFSANAEGPCYGSTSAYRIIKFDRSGEVLQEAPCF